MKGVPSLAMLGISNCAIQHKNLQGLNPCGAEYLTVGMKRCI